MNEQHEQSGQVKRGADYYQGAADGAKREAAEITRAVEKVDFRAIQLQKAAQRIRDLEAKLHEAQQDNQRLRQQLERAEAVVEAARHVVNERLLSAGNVHGILEGRLIKAVHDYDDAHPTEQASEQGERGVFCDQCWQRPCVCEAGEQASESIFKCPRCGSHNTDGSKCYDCDYPEAQQASAKPEQGEGEPPEGYDVWRCFDPRDGWCAVYGSRKESPSKSGFLDSSGVGDREKTGPGEVVRHPTLAEAIAACWKHKERHGREGEPAPCPSELYEAGRYLREVEKRGERHAGEWDEALAAFDNALSRAKPVRSEGEVKA